MGSRGRTSPPVHLKESAARYHGTRCWKDSAWPRLGVRAAGCYGRVSRWVIFSWRGRTKFSPRRPGWCIHLGVRGGPSRPFFNEGGCSAIRGGGGSWARCSGTRPPASRFVFEAIRATRPNTVRLLRVHVTMPRGHVPGWERAAAPSLLWWSCCRLFRHCQTAPHCHRIGTVMRCGCDDTRRPSGPFARW